MYFASWNAPPGAASPAAQSVPAVQPPPIELPPGLRKTLSRMVAVLAQHADGVSFADLRTHLSMSTEDLRLVIEAGLRMSEIRRIGAHNSLRYLANTPL